MRSDGPEHLPPPSPARAGLPVAFAQQSTLPAPPVVPDHELIRPIGRGAYGEVWLARHARLNTLRAVKVVRRDQFDDARPCQREFDGIRRYEPISRGHPNLVAILHVGGTDECFFYVMELADDGREPAILDAGCLMLDKRKQEADTGKQQHPESRIQNPESYSPHTLRSELKRHGALPIDRCLEIGHALAGALAHLHARGLVHRDVRPSNVIFVGGVARLADIGLVAVVSDSRSFVGTEGYIPPEGPGTPSADCYALGKLLYELSTGHDRTAWPEPPADLPTRPDRERLLELNAILHKACAAEAHRRYQSAEDMHAELALLRSGRSVKRKRAVERRLSVTWKSALAAACLAVVWLGIHWSRSFPRTSSTTEAQRWHLEGRVLFDQNNEDSVRKAVLCFQKAIATDGSFAPAFVGLSECYRWEGDYTNAKQAALRAVQLDDRLADAHAEMAIIKRTLDWDWAGAEAEFKRGIELKPSRWVAYLYYAGLLVALGRSEKALVLAEQGVRADPFSEHALNEQGAIQYFAHQYDQVIETSKAVLRINRNFERAHLHLWLAYLAKGMHAEAVAAWQRMETLSGVNPDEIAADRRAFDEQGIRGLLRKQLERALSGKKLTRQRSRGFMRS